MSEAREEEEAAGRRRKARGGRDVSLSFHCRRKKKKMTRGNGTITVPTGIQVSFLKTWSRYLGGEGRKREVGRCEGLIAHVHGGTMGWDVLGRVYSSDPRW